MKPHEQRLRGGTPPLGSLLALALLVDGRRRAASPGRAQPPCSPDLSDSWARCVKPLLGPARAAGERGGGRRKPRAHWPRRRGVYCETPGASPLHIEGSCPQGLQPDHLRKSTGPEAGGRGVRLRCHRAASARPCRTSPPVAGPGWRGSARGKGGGGRLVSQGERFIMIPRPRGCVPGAGPRVPILAFGPRAPRTETEGAKGRGRARRPGPTPGEAAGRIGPPTADFLPCW